AVLETLVVVVHRDREHALGAVLPDHVIVESVADLPGRGDLAILLSGNAALGFLADNVVAQLDALIADEHRRAGDQLANLVLRLPAEAAVEGALTVRTAEFGHILVHRPRRQPGVGRQGIRLRNV